MRYPALWLALLTAVVYAMGVVPYWKPTWDSAIYISLARALVEGNGYTYMGYPHTKYPPGFPLLMAPVVALAGDRFALLRALMVACAAASVGLTWALVRRSNSSLVAAAVSLMTASSFALVVETTSVLSDLPYMAVSLAALVAADRYREGRSGRALGVTIALVVAAWSVRLVGFTLALAVAADVVGDGRAGPLRRRVGHAVVVVGVMAAVMGAWTVRNSAVGQRLPPEMQEALSYERELIAVNPADPRSATIGVKDLARRLRNNLRYYEGLLTGLLVGPGETPPLLRHTLAVLCLGGWAIAAVRRRSALEWYILFYGSIHLLWPSTQGPRFLVPVLPMVFFYALQLPLAVVDLLTRCRLPAAVAGRVRAIAVSALAAAVVLFNMPYVIRTIAGERAEPYYDQALRDYLQAITWMRDSTPPEAIIIIERAPWVWLLARRRAYSGPWLKEQTEAIEAWTRLGVSHVITNDLRGLSKAFINPVVEAFPEHFREVRRIGRTVIYEMRR